jgi:hypothetical protein
MKIKTFIVVHDQDIILDSIHYKKYESIDNLIFLFVGNGDISKIKDRTDVIICRDLQYNIEQYKDLTSYTAWYAVWKNKLCENDIDYITFLEYDTLINQNYFQKLKKILNQNNKIDIIGYSQINIHHELFLGHHHMYADGLIESLKKIYNIDILNYIQKYSINKKCAIVTNRTIKTNIFEDYIKWSMPVVNDFIDSKYSGHFTERLVTVYYLINHSNHIFLLNAVENFEFNSSNYEDTATSNADRHSYYDYIIGKNTEKIKLNRWENSTYIT